MYLTLSECTEYLSTELWAEAWLTADPVKQQKAINKGEQIIDSIQFKGGKLLDTQNNEFPRDYQEAVPQEVKDANCLIALKLIEGRIPELDFGNGRIKSDSLASGKTTYEVFNTPQHVLYGVPSYDAWVKLLKFVNTEKVIELDRVS